MVGESQDEIPESESLHKVIDKIVGHFHQEEQEQIQTIVEKYSDDQVNIFFKRYFNCVVIIFDFLGVEAFKNNDTSKDTKLLRSFGSCFRLNKVFQKMSCK